MVRTTRHAGRWRQNLESRSRGLRSAPRLLPSPVWGCSTPRRSPAARAPQAPSSDMAAFDVGKTWALRIANIRLGFQVKWGSGEGMKQSHLCHFGVGVISNNKKDPNEQVEITSPRIYEQASNPAQWHDRGPVGRGGELIFSVLLATVAFSHCETEQRRYLRVALHGEPPVVCGGATGALVDWHQLTHTYVACFE